MATYTWLKFFRGHSVECIQQNNAWSMSETALIVRWNR